MTKPPKILYFLAGIMAAVALSFPIQVMALYGFSWQQMPAVINNISQLNFFIMAVAIASLPAILQASRWMIPILAVSTILIVWNNLIVGLYGSDFSWRTAMFATAGFMTCMLVMIHPRVLFLLRNPSQRWWLRSPRRHLSLPVNMNVIRGQDFELESFDISETGLYVPMSGDMPDDEQVRAGDVVDIRFNLGSLRAISCQAEVVRKGVSEGQYPSGVGVRFTEMSRTDRQALRRYLDSHPF